MNIKKRIDEIYEYAVSIRRHIHMNPELSDQEFETAEFISEKLNELGIEHDIKVARTGIVATITGKLPLCNNKISTVVGIRADIDALPIQEAIESEYKSKKQGIMHACGHDMHTAILIGTAKILKEMENEFYGTIKLFFQPAEETIGGANRMIQLGYMQDPKVNTTLALHVAPYLPSGTVEFCKGKMNAASTEFSISVNGTSCHGAHPENGSDSIVVASSIVCALQSITSRNLSPTNPGIVTVGRFNSGTRNNIIAGEANLSGIIRALDIPTRDKIKNRVKVLSESIALGFDAQAKVNFIDSYPALINNEEVVDIMISIAKENLGEKNIYYMKEPSLGADDFSYFTQISKGIYFNIGTNSGKEEHFQEIHNEWYNPDESSIKTGILLEVLGALKILSIGM